MKEINFGSVAVLDAGSWEQFRSLPGLEAIGVETLQDNPPDAAWMMTAADGTPAAGCSLWWTSTPPLPGHRLGLIGHFSVREPAAAGPLLRLACEQLTDHGCTLAVGPMDGSTWQRYRLVTERSTEPPFFLEPDNPDDWPAHFTGQGFTPLAHYYSAVTSDLTAVDPRTEEVAVRLGKRGPWLFPLDPARYEEELCSIFAVAREAFRDNFLYSPIKEEQFLNLYRGVRPHLRPELVLLAKQRTLPVGFVFAVPDLLQARRGQAVDTVIVKTLAVHPDWAGVGLGGLLVAGCHKAAHRLGFRRAIHALMHEDNRSRRISSHTARTIRRYALFARELRSSS